MTKPTKTAWAVRYHETRDGKQLRPAAFIPRQEQIEPGICRVHMDQPRMFATKQEADKFARGMQSEARQITRGDKGYRMECETVAIHGENGKDS